MLTISLRNVRLRGSHGVFPGEQLTGHEFIVQLSVQVEACLPVTALLQSVDYGALFGLVRRHFEKPLPLLETLCGNILTEILDKFPQVLTADIDIEKQQPPIPYLQGNTAVSLTMERKSLP